MGFASGSRRALARLVALLFLASAPDHVARPDGPPADDAVRGAWLPTCSECPRNALLIDCQQGAVRAGWVLGSGEAAQFALAGWSRRLEVGATKVGAERSRIEFKWQSSDGKGDHRAVFQVSRGEPMLPWARSADVPEGYGKALLRCVWAE
jgi:hypothetical protein